MAIDLSTRHWPVSDLFPHACDETAERYRLSADQVAFFENNGYLAGIRVLDGLQLAALRTELDELSRPDHDGRELWYEYRSNAAPDSGTVLLHASGAWRLRPAFHDLLWHPAIARPAAQLLGGPVRFLQDQLFCKPARHGGVVSWHQDYSYWTFSQPMAHLACWIALDDSTAENGCLRYVPGSHRWGLLPITGLTGEMEAIRSVLGAEQAAAFSPVPIELAAGEAAFHHPLMVHGSFGNRSGRQRRATVVNLMRDGVRAAVVEPEVDGLPAFMLRPTEETVFHDPAAGPQGQKLVGRFFPLVG